MLCVLHKLLKTWDDYYLLVFTLCHLSFSFQLKGHFHHKPIVLLGWNIGALVACHVSRLPHFIVSSFVPSISIHIDSPDNIVDCAVGVLGGGCVGSGVSGSTHHRSQWTKRGKYKISTTQWWIISKKRFIEINFLLISLDVDLICKTAPLQVIMSIL